MLKQILKINIEASIVAMRSTPTWLQSTQALLKRLQASISMFLLYLNIMALRNQPYIPLYVQDFLTDEKLNQ